MSLLLAAKGRAAVSVPNAAANATGASSPQTAFVSFNSNGNITRSQGAPLRWYDVITAGIGNDFEIYAELITGTGFTGEVFDTWISLGTNRLWQLEVVSGSATGEIKFSIRRLGETDAIASGNITFLAEVVV